VPPLTSQYYQGPAIVCVLQGRDFGPYDPATSMLALSLNRTKYPATIISWSHTAIQFYLPAGAGANLTVQPTAAGQDPIYDGPFATATPVLFTYDAPSLIAIGRADRSS